MRGCGEGQTTAKQLFALEVFLVYLLNKYTSKKLPKMGL